MKRTLLAAALAFAFTPFGHSAPPTPEESFSGIVTLDKPSSERLFGVQLSDKFDPEVTLSQAVEAKRIGDFETAFHSYWAVCESGNAQSCLDAAMLADTRILTSIPSDIVTHLYARACASGMAVACNLPPRE